MFCYPDMLKEPLVSSFSLLPSSFSPYLFIPPHVFSLLFLFLSAPHSKKSTVIDPHLQINFRDDKEDIVPTAHFIWTEKTVETVWDHVLNIVETVLFFKVSCVLRMFWAKKH